MGDVLDAHNTVSNQEISPAGSCLENHLFQGAELRFYCMG